MCMVCLLEGALDAGRETGDSGKPGSDVGSLTSDAKHGAHSAPYGGRTRRVRRAHRLNTGTNTLTLTARIPPDNYHDTVIPDALFAIRDPVTFSRALTTAPNGMQGTGRLTSDAKHGAHSAPYATSLVIARSRGAPFRAPATRQSRPDRQSPREITASPKALLAITGVTP